MPHLIPFELERWQSLHENHVTHNLSESGVHPVALSKLLDMGGLISLGDTLLSYGQTNGTQELRARIASLYPGATTDNVIVTNGSAEANLVALWELLRPGDEVVVITPAYAQTIGLALSMGATVRRVQLREALGWQLDPDELAMAVSDRTRLIVVTNPNNPTGSVLGAESRRAIETAAERVGAWILADEVYCGAETEGPETPTMWSPDANVIAVGSLSKAYGMPGLRIGWAVSSPEMIEALWARKDYTTIGPGALTDRLATVALDPNIRPRLLQRTRSMIRSGLDITEEWLNDTGVFQFRRPQAGAILFARFDLPVTSIELAERLRAEQSLLIVPGAHFEMEPYIRLGIGMQPHVLQSALECFSVVLERIAKGG